MKRIIAVGLIFIFILLPTVACGEQVRVPDGTYSCIAAETGEQYIFSGNTVRVRLYLMNKIAIDYIGTYHIEGDRITLNFPEDSDNLYNGTFYYEVQTDGAAIVIDQTTFTKE